MSKNDICWKPQKPGTKASVQQSLILSYARKLCEERHPEDVVTCWPCQEEAMAFIESLDKEVQSGPKRNA